MNHRCEACSRSTGGLWILVLLLAGGAATGCAETLSADPLQRHVEYLASESLGGRLSGSSGETKAVAYVIEQLESAGVSPPPGMDDYRMPFDFTAGTKDVGSAIRLGAGEGAEARSISGGEKVSALSFSDDGSVSGPVIFAGYGLALPEGQEPAYDSYFGLDVKDKIVLVLRYFPEDVDQEMRAGLARYSGLRYKALRARELGARALLVATGPSSPNAGEIVAMSFDTALSGSGIVAASIDGATADEILAHAGKTLEQAQQALDGGNPHVQGFEIPGLTVEVEVKVKREKKIGSNVVGYLAPNPQPGQTAIDEYIVVGAHLDHLGTGLQGNSLARKDEKGHVHHGADDNASGVSLVIELARGLAERPRRRPVLFGFWSGEELGLLGSTHFVKNPPVAAEKIAAYVNFDMVGRMRDERLTLQAVGSSSLWPKLIEQTNVVAGLDINTQEDPYLPTDATAFYQAGTPTINFFTGSHDDYHRPTDTADRVNFEGMHQIADFSLLLATKLTNGDEAPEYVKVEPRKGGGQRDSLRAFTGTIPDYTTEVEGLLLSGVIGGGPADQAGLRGGDIIVEMAGQRIANIYDYTYALDAVKIGEATRVVVVRDGERKEITITPTSRN